MRISDWSSYVCSSDLGGLLTADSEALKRVNGMGETSIAALKIAQAAALRLIKSQVRDQPVLSSWQALLDYLRADMAHMTVERVRVLHLNSRNMLIRDENMGDGSIDQRSEEHTSELQSLMRISYAVFCLKKKKHIAQ